MPNNESETFHIVIPEDELRRILDEVDDDFEDLVGLLDDEDLEHLK